MHQRLITYLLLVAMLSVSVVAQSVLGAAPEKPFLSAWAYESSQAPRPYCSTIRHHYKIGGSANLDNAVRSVEIVHKERHLAVYSGESVYRYHVVVHLNEVGYEEIVRLQGLAFEADPSMKFGLATRLSETVAFGMEPDLKHEEKSASLALRLNEGDLHTLFTLLPPPAQ